ncbi:MAG: tetratricopeptide repeat protein [Flavobacteriales bacterium]|nr:tetratricopeptide repeat protein [Flavobacteriales bacterium]
MKNLILLMAIITAGGAFAQNAKVVTAYRYLNNGEFEEAREAIEPATTHEKTMGKDKTWRYRGDIYLGLAGESENDKVSHLQEAHKSFLKAKELDTKENWSEEINVGLNKVRIESLNSGIEAFEKEKFGAARDLFILSGDVGNALGITDTLAYYNGGLAAEQAEDYENAIKYYKKTAETEYLEGKLWLYIANVYNRMEDPEGYISTIKEGREKYPEDADLIIYELNYYLQNSKFKEAEDNLKLALEKEPDNKQLYFSLGVVYENLEKPEEAVKAYKDAIEIDPDYFDANYNLGAHYFNQGVEMNNAANEIQDNKKYDAARAEAKKVFEKAKPFLEKAHAQDETDMGALVSLSQLYALLNETEKYQKIKDKLDAEQGK